MGYSENNYGGIDFVSFTTSDGFESKYPKNYFDSQMLDQIGRGQASSSDISRWVSQSGLNINDIRNGVTVETKNLNNSVSINSLINNGNTSGLDVITGTDGSTYARLRRLPSSLSDVDRRELLSYQASSANGNYTASYLGSDGVSYEVRDGHIYRKTTLPSNSTSTSTSSTKGTNSSNTKTSSTNSSANSSTSSSTTYTDVKGLDAAGISAIKNAIESFVKGYSSKVSGVGTTTAVIQQAVKGTMSEKMIANFSDAINASVMQSLNKLNTFANQLDTVKSEYAKADSSNTTVSSYMPGAIKSN